MGTNGVLSDLVPDPYSRTQDINFRLDSDGDSFPMAVGQPTNTWSSSVGPTAVREPSEL